MTSEPTLIRNRYLRIVLAAGLLFTAGDGAIQAAGGEARTARPLPRKSAVGNAGEENASARRQRWRFGMRVKARGNMTGVIATLPVPREWPEQDVKTVDREQARAVRSVRFRELDQAVTQMRIAIPRLSAGEEANAIVTMGIIKRDGTGPPEHPEQLRTPSRLSREMRQYLRPSPYINSQDRVIVEAAKQLVENQNTAWGRVEAIYDWVREKVEYRFARKIKSARKALEDGYGDCEELTSLFIAMCRAVQIPARAVWVPGHCYPEFFLEDAEGKGRWYPCQAAGTRSFGHIQESRPILQKGDNIRVPDSRQTRRYARETLAAQHSAAPPVVEFIRQPLDGAMVKP